MIEAIVTAAITLAFEDHFAPLCFMGIEETTIPVIPPSIKAYVIEAESRYCQCTPRCRTEVLVLQHGVDVSFITPNHYDKIGITAARMLKEYESILWGE